MTLLQLNAVNRESLQKFESCLAEKIPGIERGITRLKRSPGDKALLADLHRALQNIKDDALICQVQLGELVAKPIETLLDRLASDEIVCSELLAEVLLLALDRLELAVETSIGSRPLEQLRLSELVAGLDKLTIAPSALIDDTSIQLIEAVTGFRPTHPAVALPPRSSAIARSSEQVAADLLFFRLLTKQFEARSPLFKGRRQRLLQLALDTNECAGKLVDPVQLEAAVYFHDVGMLLLPESIWLKAGKLTDEEKYLMQAHPTMAAGLMERMEGWQPAAQMVAQHHEMPDGGGYPKRLKTDEICPGAKILAIVDAFEAVTLKHSDRGLSRSILRAIAEVNACNTQFAPEWTAPFNVVIRRMLES